MLSQMHGNVVHPNPTRTLLRRSRPIRCKATAATPAAAATAIKQAAAGQQFGASSTELQKQTLLELVAELKAQQPAAQTAPTEGPLDGCWQLLWTSEASVHGIVRGLVPVTHIQQDIDLRGAARVANTIGFGWLGRLQASGPLTVLNSSRIFYSFDQLRLGLLGWELPLPVVFKGGGWTDCVLLLDDNNLRVMENSRRDTLVLQRVV